jgi:hypothetical protein
VRDAFEINSAGAIIRREAAAYLELRRGCFPVLLPVGVETLRKRVAQFDSRNVEAVLSRLAPLCGTLFSLNALIMRPA